jgi:hypothetical protein
MKMYMVSIFSCLGDDQNRQMLNIIGGVSLDGWYWRSARYVSKELLNKNHKKRNKFLKWWFFRQRYGLGYLGLAARITHSLKYVETGFGQGFKSGCMCILPIIIIIKMLHLGDSIFL